MRMDPVRLAIHRHPSDPLRACVHDLRNLFAVVASAKSLLERPLDERRKRVVMDGLARVASEGKVVTDALLSKGSDDHEAACDASAELSEIASIVKTLEHASLRIDLSSNDDSVQILMAPAEFRAVVLELVTNAATAGARKITIRATRRGCRYWMVVADNGSGFPQQDTFTSPAPRGLHGTGLRRLASAVGSAHGRIKIRSEKGAGSVVALVLPIIGVVAAASSQLERVGCSDRSTAPEEADGKCFAL